MAGEEEQFALTLKLTVAGYNAIMQALGTMPYNQVKPLVENLDQQAQAQVQAFNSQKEATMASAQTPEVEPVPVVD